ncbi:hypothetical protein EVA_02316 [gut metagenome]|uniref:Uncharacterized protein n=1 Tax=gut metagenome TaxID=749906 RepID=J9H698_9ZZZZ
MEVIPDGWSGSLENKKNLAETCQVFYWTSCNGKPGSGVMLMLL